MQDIHAARSDSFRMPATQRLGMFQRLGPVQWHGMQHAGRLVALQIVQGFLPLAARDLAAKDAQPDRIAELVFQQRG